MFLGRHLKKPESFRVPWLKALLGLGLAHGLHATEPVQDEWNLFTPAQDLQLGSELSAWLESRVQLSREPATNRFLDRLQSRLTHPNRNLEYNFTFKLVDNQGLYSFVYPGGPVYFTNGLLAALETEELFAGLAAHQMAHIALRHTTRAISRAERFRLRAALVVAATTGAPLSDSLEQADIPLAPGAPLSGFNAAAEAEAQRFASQLMFDAGYQPGVAERALALLRDRYPEQAGQFLRQHPPIPREGVALPDEEFASPKSPNPLISPRAYQKLRSIAGRSTGRTDDLQSLIAWSPPVPEVTPARSRELFISRSYSFSYPNSWQVGKRESGERIQVAPKGGIINPAGGVPKLRIGILAGTLELADINQTATEALQARIDSIRPGLALAADQSGIEPHARGIDNMMLRGGTGPGSRSELVWAAVKRLPENHFYLLMIAPENEFADYRHEFEAIFNSIEFLGHPDLSRMDALSEGGLLGD